MKIAPLLLLSLATGILPGCGTLVGLTVGLGIDAAQPDSIIVAGSSLVSVTPGTEARLRLRDGSEREVVVGPHDVQSLETHAATIADRQRNAERPVPVPPAMARLQIDHAVHPRARLEGYDVSGLWAAVDTGRSAALIPWAKLKRLTIINGDDWAGDSLRRRCVELQMPSRTGRWIRSNEAGRPTSAGALVDAREFVPNSDIDRIVVTPSSNAVWWGLAAGMAADLVIVAVAAQSMRFNFGGMGSWK